MQIEQLKLMPTGVTAKGQESQVKTDKNFGEYLTNALDKVNQLQHESQQASIDLAAGKVQDLSQVVIATEKATIALQLTMQVRNKVVDAYQEIMRMQV